MGVPTAIQEASSLVPAYMLNGKDPADEQEEAAAEAHKFGISLVVAARNDVRPDAQSSAVSDAD